MGHHHSLEPHIMDLNSLFRSLLAAYAYGAIGTYDQRQDKPARD
ncbi:MAG: hypothetical protein ACOH2R_01400 [Pseudomonas sp.]